MAIAKKQEITVQGFVIKTFKSKDGDYISLTDIARNKNATEPKDVIKNWMRSKSTIEFLGLWEQINNTCYKGVEFDSFINEAGSNAFTLSPSKWISNTDAIGIITKQGKNGGTYAHKDIAFEFASWVSSAFKLYLIKEFQRLKEDESDRLKLHWNFQRTLSKVNYKIHTDAIKEILIPIILNSKQTSIIYTNEADVLNIALFGKTAKQWRDENPKEKGNIRDFATIQQLVVLSNLESINAMLIHQNITQKDRLIQLNELAISQIKSLVSNTSIKKLND